MEGAATRRWHHVGRLCALSLLLAYAETFVPIPIPGLRLGLANIPVLVALSRHDEEAAITIAVVKVLTTGLLFGSPLTLAYALAGTTCSLLGMLPLSRLKTMRLQMTSIAGALLHEAGQLLVASGVLGTNVVWLLTPALLVGGIVCGALSGELAARLERVLPEDDDETQGGADVEPPSPLRPQAREIALGCALVVFVAVVFHVRDLACLAALTGAALVACLANHVGGARLASTAALVAATGATTLVLQLVVAPATAVTEAAVSTLRLAAVALACRACAPALLGGDVAGSAAWLLQPLGLLGLDVGGMSVALAVALSSIEAASIICREHAEASGGRLGPRALARELPGICRELWERT